MMLFNRVIYEFNLLICVDRFINY